MITIEPDFIYLTCTDQQARKLDAVWVKSKKQYRLPNTLGALRELHKQGFDVMTYGKLKSKQRQDFLDLKNKENKSLQLDKRLREYQRIDISFLQHLPAAGVFLEQRLGKTPLTIQLMELEKHEKIIVVCPASLVLNWCNEVTRWSLYKAYPVSGNKIKRQKIYDQWTLNNGFLVLSYETLRNDVDLLNSKNYALIVDESHRLKGYQTKQSKAVFNLGKNAVKKLALTGTPATNAGQDLYGILHFLYPSRFPSYWAFIDRYFKQWTAPWGVREISGYKRKEELQEILDLISVQRKRSEVMQWLPPKQYQTISLEMPSKQRKAYDEMLHMFTVEEAGVDASGVLAQLTRLRQICLAPELLDIKAPSAKEQFILEWLEDNPDEQVIIFSNFSSYLKKLQYKLFDKFNEPIETITGDVNKENRYETVKQFQAGKLRIILANIQAAGTGLTLDAAGTVIFLDRAYTPSDNAQAEDRIVPTTQQANQSCTIIDVVCKNSVDETINDLLSKKQNVIEVINNYKSIRELV